MIARRKDDQCKGTTKSGTPCQRKAGDSGYCNLHDPVKQKKQAKKKQKTNRKKVRLYDLINMVINTSRAKGWEVYRKSVDKDEWRYATLSVSRTEDYEKVTGLVEISCNSKISISTEKTSFHDYGLDSLKVK